MRDVLNAAIAADGRTLPAIAAAGGIDRALLWRYVTGRRDITTDTASKLVDGLGLRVQLEPRGRGRKVGRA